MLSSSLQTLDEWLHYIESIHHQEIELGLSRIAQVAQQLRIDLSATKVVTVAGTNGKGTTCAFIEQALLSQGRAVMVYSSPHIQRFNERLRFNGVDVVDHLWVDAFAKVEQARATISLSYYEFTTLAALLIAMQHQLDVLILEVGLGGRLDATNVVDADIAVVTTIDLDHMAFLGDSREKIGIEKIGIARANRLCIMGEANPPESVIAKLNQLGAKLILRGRDFDCTEHNQSGWRYRYQNEGIDFDHLPEPFIPKANVATALTVLHALALPLTNEPVRQLISAVKVPGRLQQLQAQPDLYVDVAHNPEAARYLAQWLGKKSYRQVHAIVGMLKDKDISNTLKPLFAQIDHWYTISLAVPRGANANQLQARLIEEKQSAIACESIEQAYQQALQHADKSDLILVFGSFFTVSAMREIV